MNPRSAAHLCDVAAAIASVDPAAPAFASVAVVETAICAMFFANRSLSPTSIFSRRFMAPGRLFMLLRRIMLTWSFASVPAGPRCSGESSSGRVAASESSVATSLLFGRRRRGFLACDFVILDISAACLMWRLSLLVDGKSKELEVESFMAFGEDEDDFFNADFRGLGALWIGA
jgi:hypothetical protein